MLGDQVEERQEGQGEGAANPDGGVLAHDIRRHGTAELVTEEIKGKS